jgi:hypothetical protein
MDHDTSGPADATLLPDLEGLAVTGVTRRPDGSRVVAVDTADECAGACPACGVLARRVKEHVYTRPRDLPCGSGRVDLVWRERRWYCDEDLCPRGSFTESPPGVPARSRTTARPRAHAGDLVVDGITATVDAAADLTGPAWATVMDAVRARAEAVLPDAHGPVTVLGIDEVRRGRPRCAPCSCPRSAATPRTRPSSSIISMP